MKEGFSVSMCVYHGDDAANFQTAVESVLAQTCLPEEVVLVVDGPVPAALEEVISAYEKNPLFRVLWLEKNCGHGAARRAGLEACREAYGEEWDDGEYYLVRDELESALPWFDVDCIPISFCADVMILSPAD